MADRLHCRKSHPSPCAEKLTGSGMHTSSTFISFTQAYTQNTTLTPLQTSSQSKGQAELYIYIIYIYVYYTLIYCYILCTCVYYVYVFKVRPTPPWGCLPGQAPQGTRLWCSVGSCLILTPSWPGGGFGGGVGGWTGGRVGAAGPRLPGEGAPWVSLAWTKAQPDFFPRKGFGPILGGFWAGGWVSGFFLRK